MRGKRAIAVPFLAIAAAANASATTIWTWTGADSNNWSDALNWTNGTTTGLPTTGDTVILTGQGSFLPTNQDISNLSLATMKTDGTLANFTLDGSASQTLTLTGTGSTAGFYPSGTFVTTTMAAGTNATVYVSPAAAASIASGATVSQVSNIPAGSTVIGVSASNGAISLNKNVNGGTATTSANVGYAFPTTWNADMTVASLNNGPANTTINGNLTLSGNATWSSSNSFGILTVSGNINTGNHTLILNGGRTGNYQGAMLVVNGDITGSGLLEANANMVKLNGDNSNFTGTIKIANGALSINSDSALGAVPASYNPTYFQVPTDFNQLSELDLTGTGFTVNANRGVTIGGSGLIFNAQSGTTYYFPAQINTSGVTDGRVGNGVNLTQQTSEEGGTIILSGNNTFAGGFVASTSSEIGVTSDNVLGAVPGSATRNSILFSASYNGSAKMLFADSMTLNSNRGVVIGNTGTSGNTANAQFDVAPGQTLNYAGTIANNDLVNAWQDNLIKSGAGTFVFSGVGTYTGNTTVSAGTMLVNDNGQATPTITLAAGKSYTVIASSGATLGGNGTIQGNALANGDVIVNTGGALAPGAVGVGSVGTLTIDGNFKFAGGASGTTAPTWHVDLDGSSADLLTINGAFITLTTSTSNKVDIALNALSSLDNGQYTLATWTGTGPTLTSLSEFYLTYGNTGLTASTAQLGVGAGDLVLNVSGQVPEPASLSLITLSSLGLLKRRRRHSN